MIEGGGEMLQKVTKSEGEWREVLTEEQFRILRRKGTERAFSSSLHVLKDEGVYRCAACDLDLFGSDAKFDSGTGWPSFHRPVEPAHVAEKADNSLFTRRTEVLCARCDGHLGHVFKDGPPPTGLRYCINGVALKFVPENAAGGG
jgi:peptide-methionine (R)-S-oxide reductase